MHKMENKKETKELLAPCGDLEALRSAILGGANAVYLGLDSFNARIRAKNFTSEDLKEGVALAHAHGVKVYVTLNTQLYARELSKMLECVSFLWETGLDALIVADLGVASLIKEKFLDFELHASTQCTVHNLDGANFLNESLGFTRVVLARELDKENIEYISKNARAETEIFIHGAHCMSVSGGCLLSYAMGGRSGNRGECAQPCRLPYKIGGKSGYHLSLKDMSLSEHIMELLTCGACSFKIEGRMKSPLYVKGVTEIYRRLFDEKRNANFKEKQTLEALFSRQGFTDGYFKASINEGMLGVRSERDKKETNELEKDVMELPKAPVSLYAELYIGKNAMLKIKSSYGEATVYGDIVSEAINAPMSREDIEKSLSKLGSTPYYVKDIEIKKSEGIMIPKSALNALRRLAIEELALVKREKIEWQYKDERQRFNLARRKTAYFLHPEAIPQNRDYFDIIFVPLHRYSKEQNVNGIALPPVIFDSEWQEVEKQLENAYKNGIKYALITNVGQIKRVKAMGFELVSDMRINVFNGPCVDFLMKNQIKGVILSPELTLPQINDLQGASIVAYGKIPVMTSHKCILKNTVGCKACSGYLQDRQGAEFYVEGIPHHRCVIYNSVPIYMADRLDKIKNHSHHFIFTDETKAQAYEIIEAYKNGVAPKGNVKRIK